MATPPRGLPNGNVPQSSYSTSDLPTLKSINGDKSTSNGVSAFTSPPARQIDISTTTSPQQNSIALSRVNSGNNAFVNRQSVDLSGQTKAAEASNRFESGPSGLQANAAPFGPTTNIGGDSFQSFTSPNMSPYAQPAFYGGYGMQMLNNGFGNMNLHGGFPPQPQQWPNQGYPQNGLNGFQQFPQNGQPITGTPRFNDNTRAVAQQRRAQQEETQAKYQNISIDQLRGEIYGLCTDQHGCRFLQRKLDERDEHALQVIFEEVNPHIIKLMTDPFGNYLCQKLLENCNDEQRTALIRNATSAMTQIALNQHGTRALQKMIEFISLPEQTNLIIEALRFDVVQLIQDLNGNHVIQKCLNHLSAPDAQFIFDAVGANCITVGTHRHGCCVLQRCVDHASGLQKGELVRQITNDAYQLVQDPFGNYVVQYILDLQEPAFTEPLCRSFLGHIVLLSKQKFSSNVIEKCIRCAAEETKRLIIQEIAPASELEKLLRDSFANYVVQTAMDFADPDTKIFLVDNLRPILPTIRHTPYGRRIQTKIQEYDGGRTSGVNSGVITPNDASATSPPPSSAGGSGSISYAAFNTPTGRGNRMGFVASPPKWNGAAGPGSQMTTPSHSVSYGGSREIASPTPQRSSGVYGTVLIGNDNAQNTFGSPNGVNNSFGQAFNGPRSGPGFNLF